MYRLTCSKTLVCNKLSISLLYIQVCLSSEGLSDSKTCEVNHSARLQDGRWNNDQIIESNFSIQDVDECLLCSDLLWTLRKSYLIYGSTGHFSQDAQNHLNLPFLLSFRNANRTVLDNLQLKVGLVQSYEYVQLFID